MGHAWPKTRSRGHLVHFKHSGPYKRPEEPYYRRWGPLRRPEEPYDRFRAAVRDRDLNARRPPYDDPYRYR
ncbi:hypothetical protein DPMN_172956 [Dreissena polymorpha]|uniref:Uncharacterized protein n=1 Tax=Dreissena polymorpha TaxID=45954 RepID=A0A9D4E463_DREPO|nr:hypothetical protein DPMN_172956 [Dreissena polymorpha]